MWKKKVDFEVKPLPGLCYSAWERELSNDVDRDFILNCIKHSFDIADIDDQVSPVLLPNHPSAKPQSDLYDKATEQVLNEIRCGNYLVCDPLPKIVNGCYPQTRWWQRLIHDCSRPHGSSVNHLNGTRSLPG